MEFEHHRGIAGGAFMGSSKSPGYTAGDGLRLEPRSAVVATTKKTVSNHSFSGYPQPDDDGRTAQTLGQAQQFLYEHLLQAVKAWPPEEVLTEFQYLFIDHSHPKRPKVLSALQVILFANNEQEFKNTLKRCCYILVNNWEMSRQPQAIQDLVELFKSSCIYRSSLSPTLKRLRQWLINFINSSDYQELELFAQRLLEERKFHQPEGWAARYTPYLLVPQYINEDNPVEQRQAARAMARRLKEKFKFDLAMYTAHSESNRPHRAPTNPTELGDGTLRLIKAVVAQQGRFGYRNLARLFLAQVSALNYGGFKRSLVEYLIYSVKAHPLTSQIKARLNAVLTDLYSEFDDRPLDPSLLLRTCDRIIDALMTEDQETPSDLFTLLLSQSSSITLAIILLKLVLISPKSNPYLEARIANLIRYYEQFSQEECQWVIHFLEVFRVIFALYTENMQYSLVRVAENPQESIVSWEDLTEFRIFSQTVSSEAANGHSGASPPVAESPAEAEESSDAP